MNRPLNPILKATLVAISISLTTSSVGLLYFGTFQKTQHISASPKTGSHEKLSDLAVSKLKAIVALSKPAQPTHRQAQVLGHSHTPAHLSSIPSGPIEVNSRSPALFILSIMLLATVVAISSSNVFLLLGSKWLESKKSENRELAEFSEDWLDQFDQDDDSVVSASRQVLLNSLPDSELLTEQITTLKRESDQAKSELMQRVVALEQRSSEAEVPFAYLLSGESWQWNNWRSQHRNRAISLAGIDLTGKSLRSFDLSHVNLSDAILVAVDFDYANFTHADLSGATLTRSSFVAARLHFADLRYAKSQHSNFDRAELNYARLNGADLSGSSMSSAQLLGACLTDAILTSTDLNHAVLKSANLTQMQASFSNFKSADFTGATLVRADLSHSNVYWAKFSGADVSGADFTSALFDQLSWLAAISSSKDVIVSNTWRYDSATKFDHTLFSQEN